ncbi:MAG: topoisomerase 1 [Pseudomonadota bacterium]|jgi:DNA topoisomerase-1
MSKHLVIVESPAKAKTIEKYLGATFKVLASYGHVRDLIPKEGAVDPEQHFAMRYQVIERNQRHVNEIVAALKSAEFLYLATDPDREGEAISWHLLELLKEKKALKNKTVYRVVFYEITQKAVTEAIAHPGELSLTLVNAQQARRALDYLVGFKLSPLLWKKIRRGLSAGRVQSPALRMIVERTLEIEAFISREYWTISAELMAEDYQFIAKLTHVDQEKLSQFSLETATVATTIQQQLLAASDGLFRVAAIDKKQRKRYPSPPFTTSTLQQEASRKLGFAAKRTMTVAQQLYEGMDMGGETTGLISYMRTDSVNLAEEAIAEIRQLIVDKYGNACLPDEAQHYKTKSKNAQEAHEAIRPTSAWRLPAEIKPYLTDEQFKLYDLIWKRTIACQMNHATMDLTSIDFVVGQSEHRFRASGSVVVEQGFMSVYLEGQDDTNDGEDHEALLPALKVGQTVIVSAIKTHQHFTEPPPRYSESSLVKSLEEHGIGRPSTYATIISTLQNRDYVTLEAKRFYPTDVGRIVNKFLTEHFTKYVDYHFTADLEDNLDAVARGEKDWIPLMAEFWQPFKQLIEVKDTQVQRKDVTQEALDEACPECQHRLSIRLGKNGRFIGCTNYPNCSYTRNLEENLEVVEPEIVKGRSCPQCESDLVIKLGKYGKFIGCSAYPKCKHIEPLDKPSETGIECPACKQGVILKRKSRNNKIFYSCSTYPKCDYALWNEPINQSCPECHWPVLMLKSTQRRGLEKVCPQKNCHYKIAIENEAVAEVE